METAAYERGMNPEQLEVIRHEGGPIRVLAQAGSGKTRALVHRVARLVDLGVSGDRIFCTTFSRKAADEMDARLRHIGVRGVSVQTWHAFCYRVLREDQTEQGRWTLDEKDRAKIFVKKAMGHEHENWVGGDLTKVRNFIGRCKANLFAPDSQGASELAKSMFSATASRAIRVYAISQGLIEDAQLLTFDDMLVFAYRHLECEEHRLAWAGRFDYVMVDECQDNSLVQVCLQEQLARDHQNIMVIGDLAQAIYSFRGSKPDHLAAFPHAWPGTKGVAMCRNYRSGSEIVRCANDVIRPALFRQPEDMIAAREPASSGKVEVVSANTLEDEAGEFVSFLRAHVEAGKKLSDVVVLFRLNAQSRSLEEALLKSKIPYVIVGGTNFYERKEVKDLLAYLRVISARDREDDSVKRCINAPFRFLGAKFVERVMAIVATSNAGWDEVVHQAARQAGIQRRQVDSAMSWVALIQDGMKMVLSDEPKSAYEVLNFIVQRTNYIGWLEKEEGEESIESSHAANVRELLRVAQQFATVDELLDYVDLNVKESAKQRKHRGENVVTMMSIHRSKGLEWPIVWLVGCNETILPHAKGEPEEERRLMYVAVTRARDHFIASHVTEMATRAGLRTLDRSEYLDAFPEPSNVVPSEPPEAVVVMQGDFVSQNYVPGTLLLQEEIAKTEQMFEVLAGMPVNPCSLDWLGDGAQCAACGEALRACRCDAAVHS